MLRYEYTVVPAPKKPGKLKGIKGTENKFAAELSRLMNEMGAEGWEYQRTDTLPCEERQGLTGKTTTFQTMLVFRRSVAAVDADAPVSADQTLAEPATAVQAATPPRLVSRAPVAVPAQHAPSVTEDAAAKDSNDRAPVFTFRTVARAPEPSAARIGTPTQDSAEAPARKITATKDAPEGNPPEIRFRPSSDQIAAQ